MGKENQNPRPLTSLSKADFFLIDAFKREKGFVRSKAITTLVRFGVWVWREHKELYDEFKRDGGDG